MSTISGWINCPVIASRASGVAIQRFFLLTLDCRALLAMTTAVYQMTSSFPEEERYGLAQQMRRAAVSIPSNLAEGAGRNGAKKYLHFIGIARGALAELETQLQLAVMLGFATSDHRAFDLANSTGKLLTGLHKKLSTT